MLNNATTTAFSGPFNQGRQMAETATSRLDKPTPKVATPANYNKGRLNRDGRPVHHAAGPVAIGQGSTNVPSR